MLELSDHSRRAAARKFGENGHFCHMQCVESEWCRGEAAAEPAMTTIAVPAAASRRGHFGRFVLFVWENHAFSWKTCSKGVKLQAKTGARGQNRPKRGVRPEGGVMKSFLSHEIGPGGHSFPHEMDGSFGQGGSRVWADCQVDGIKN